MGGSQPSKGTKGPPPAPPAGATESKPREDGEGSRTRIKAPAVSPPPAPGEGESDGGRAGAARPKSKAKSPSPPRAKPAAAAAPKPKRDRPSGIKPKQRRPGPRAAKPKTKPAGRPGLPPKPVPRSPGLPEDREPEEAAPGEGSAPGEVDAEPDSAPASARGRELSIGTEFDLPIETAPPSSADPASPERDPHGKVVPIAPIPEPGIDVLERPRRIGRCELFAEIASGGMATVHLGRWLGAGGFSKSVAVKALHAQYARDPEFVHMFLDEAQVVARIRHPNVMPTIDLVEDQGELFIVMEYVEGVTLAYLMRKARAMDEKIPMPVALRIMTGVLHGLHAAHEAKDSHGKSMGIIHRDVSPDNILVGVDGYARLIDFGIARALGRFSATRDGELKGKLSYLSPEQVLGKKLTRQADVFAASIVLWQALTTEKLFPASNAAAVAHLILNKPIKPASKVVEGIPRKIDAIVLRGLERDVAERWSSAEVMAEAIESVTSLASHRTVGQFVQEYGAERLRKNARAIEAMEAAPTSTSEKVLHQPMSIRPAPPEAISDDLARDLAALKSLSDEEFRTDITKVERLGALQPAATPTGSDREGESEAAAGGASSLGQTLARLPPWLRSARVLALAATVIVLGIAGWAVGSLLSGPSDSSVAAGSGSAIAEPSPSGSSPSSPASAAATAEPSSTAAPTGDGGGGASATAEAAGGADAGPAEPAEGADAGSARGAPTSGGGHVPQAPGPGHKPKAHVPWDI